MEKKYDHNEVVKLLSQMQACVDNMRAVRINFQHALAESQKETA